MIVHFDKDKRKDLVFTIAVDKNSYVDEIMKTPNLQRSIVSYFCETIITPYIIRKHNRNICVGRVLTHL